MVSKKRHSCELCGKNYVQEKSFLNHKCVIGERLEKRNEVPFVLAYTAYSQFQHKMFPSTKKKYADIMEFVKSKFYNGFFKYGEYMTAVNVLDIKSYTNYLLKNDIPLTYWTDEKIYDIYMTNYIKAEDGLDAIQRSMETISKWSNRNEAPMLAFFKIIERKQLFMYIKRGHISPWFLYNTKSGRDFLKSIPPIHIENLYGVLDPEYWETVFNANKDKVTAIKEVLKKTGI